MNILKEYFADNHKIIIVDAFFKIKELNVNDVLIFSKILMLSDNDDGGCTSANWLFADFLGISENHVGRVIHKLEFLNLITISKIRNQKSGHTVRLITPVLATILKYKSAEKTCQTAEKTCQTAEKTCQTAEKTCQTTEKYSPKNTSQTHIDKGFAVQKNDLLQKNRRIQKNIRTEERQTHEQKSISEIDWSNFDSNSSSVSDSDFFVSDISDSGLVKQLEEHMHESQAQDLIRKYGTQKVEIALNKVNNRNPANKGGYLMAMLKKDNETPTVKDQAAKEDKAKKEQLAKSEKNWNAINRSLNTNQAELKQFYQDLINKQKPNYSTINKIKTLLDTYPTGLINKPFDILLASRTISINYLKALLYQIETEKTEKVSQYG